jgi:tRNA threonylcarbamoyladenosine biosynthesis protein TsaB
VKVILALDTATAILSAALSAGDRYWYREAGAGLTHSELLLDMVDALFKEAALKPEDLEAVACMKGPGSFTGLRIGFAAAKGMALALDIPLIACPTLDCLAYPWLIWPGLVIPVLDAKKGRFFSALYAGGARISAEMDTAPEALAACIDSLDKKSEKKPESGPLRPAGAAGMPPPVGPPPLDPAAPILITGPEAPLFLSRLREKSGDRESLLQRMRLDPLYRKGRSLELTAVAKERAIMNNDKGDVFSGPEYLRKSDAEK